MSKITTIWHPLLFVLNWRCMSKIRKALITGVTGQDGSYLAELLLSKGYEVHGLVRRSSTFNTERIDHLLPVSRGEESPLSVYREYGDLTDGSSIFSVLQRIDPDEVYNLGAQSHVRVSFDIPEYTADATGMGTLRVLEAIRTLNPKIKFYQASSSEMFGKVLETPQKETTPFNPQSPYGCSKAFAHYMTKNYREGYGIFACSGILFNHESPRRGKTFVTRKITQAMCRIKLGKQEKFYLGNLEARRDWGYAKDYVEAMWLMMQQNKPDDFVVATGETRSVREFVEAVADVLDMRIVWKGKGLDEKGINAKTGKVILEIDPYFFRPAEVDILVGDYSKAKSVLGWEPETSFRELVSLMVGADLEEEKDR